MGKILALVVLLAAAVSAGPVPEKQLEELPLLPRLPGRIINGTETSVEEHPHQVSLHIPNRGHMCGGSIISKHWVLTAGHCMAVSFASRYIVIAGMSNLLEGGTHHHIEKYIVHKDYYINRFGALTNDIALIKVAEPFNFDSKHRAVPLFEANEESRAGYVSVVSGWGYTGFSYPDQLNSVVVPIMSKARCNELYSYIGGLPVGEICAGFEQGEKDACTGDSGGPLTIDGRLAGVVSWGHGCAESGRPGVYAEVASYRDWIRLHSGV